MKSEFELLEKFKKIFVAKTHSEVLYGIGDDCTEIRSDKSLLLSVDVFSEGIHFDRSYFSSGDIAWKAVATAISDIYASGGKPFALLIALQCPQRCGDEELWELVDGLRVVAEHWGLDILGGDTTKGENLSLVVTAIGRVAGNCAWRRNAAQVDDDLWISSTPLGLSGAGLAALQEQEEHPQQAINFHRRPEIPVKICETLWDMNVVNAAIDVSDGLLIDVFRIAKASNLLVHIECKKLILFQSKEWSSAKSMSSGEDYNLLFTANSKKRKEIEDRFGNLLCRIGYLSETDTSGIYIDSGPHEIKGFLDEEKIRKLGFDHFGPVFL